MKFYIAPLEGITGYVYRRAYQEMFHNVDKYFIPFVEPHRKRSFNTKEQKEISPENNRGAFVVPQILTCSSEDFLHLAEKLAAEGYPEVNLNLGCPSGTVVPKGKGAGFLEFPDRLDRFLEEIFRAAHCRISVKTRIGRYEPEEFGPLLAIFNRYPLEELIVHPRTREDYYKNTPDWNAFGLAVRESKNMICYNGDIFTAADFGRLRQEFPEVDRVMLGRGILRDPQLVDELKTATERDWRKLRRFHDRIFREYQETLSGERALLFKMKELWNYELALFPGSEKLGKKLKKAQHKEEYLAIVEQLFGMVE